MFRETVKNQQPPGIVRMSIHTCGCTRYTDSLFEQREIEHAGSQQLLQLGEVAGLPLEVAQLSTHPPHQCHRLLVATLVVKTPTMGELLVEGGIVLPKPQEV